MSALPNGPPQQLLDTLAPFQALVKIALATGLEPREFIAQVNSHIEALQAWETRRQSIARADALRGTPRPVASACDSEASFQSALKFWTEVQAASLRPDPAPAAPIAVERAIAVHTAADGSRTYTYIEEEWGVSAFRDSLIRKSRESL